MILAATCNDAAPEDTRQLAAEDAAATASSEAENQAHTCSWAARNSARHIFRGAKTPVDRYKAPKVRRRAFAATSSFLLSVARP